MPIVDVLDKVCVAQQITANADSGSSIDLGATTVARQIGTGEPIGFGVFVTANGTNTGSCVVSIIESAAAALSGPVILASLTLVTAEIQAGQKFFIAMPPAKPALRYIGLTFVKSGTVDFTCDAFLMAASSFPSTPYPTKGFTVA